MPLPLPNLDDRRYADLLQEAQDLIPSLYPKWTDHNPSDPGITLIEMLAWLTEMVIYRVNRVPEANSRTFLQLLRGPDWKPEYDLEEDKRETVLGLRERHRAVTCEDYEKLAKQTSSDVARAKCVPQRNLAAGAEADRRENRPGHISVILVPRSEELSPQPSKKLVQKVWDYLEPLRVLTTRLHVVGPIYVPVGGEFLIARRADMPEKDLREEVLNRLADLFRPVPGERGGEGWPFGRDIHLAELYELLEDVPGVDYVPDISLSSKCPPGVAPCAVATELWHEDGSLIGLGLEAHHMPQAQIDPACIVVSASFVPVRLTIHAVPVESVEPAAARRAITTVARHAFHPLHDGPDGKQAKAITRTRLSALVRDLPEVERVESIDLQTDPAHLLRDQQGRMTGVRFEERELADLQVATVLG